MIYRKIAKNGSRKQVPLNHIRIHVKDSPEVISNLIYKYLCHT